MAGLLSQTDLGDAADKGPIRPAQLESQPPGDTMALGHDGKTLADDEPNVTPEEQAEYESFVNNGYLLIYSEQNEVRPNVKMLLDPDPQDLKSQLPTEAWHKLQSEGQFSPVGALAGATVRIVLQLVASAKQAGKDISGDVIFQGGKALLEDLAMIAKGEKMHDFTQEELDQSMVLAAAMYYAAAKERGWVDDAPLQEEFSQIEQAAKRDGPAAVPSLFGIRRPPPQ
jgi:hypothetical protein